MITAKEAKEYTETNIKSIEQMLFNELINKAGKTVKEQTKCGRSVCYVRIDDYSTNVVRKAMDYLRTLGYKCEISSSYYIAGDFLRIEW